MNRTAALLIPIFLTLGIASASADELTVTAVQWEMDMEYITEPEEFWEDVEEVLTEQEPETLVVFPEYTSVFLALDEFGPIVEAHDTFLGAWGEVSSEYGYQSIEELFTKQSLEMQGEVVRWKNLAREYECYIIPGTYFVYEPETKDLVNRMIVIDPDGGVIYSQDKVYCTPFEEEYCGIEGGEVSDAQPFTIEGQEVAVTICRDTFFSEWEDQFGQVDLWIDIKANGTQFTEEEEERFTRAVPERVEESGSRYGLTLCLTGEAFNLFWEGESSLVDTQGSVLENVATVDSFDTLTFEIPL